MATTLDGENGFVFLGDERNRSLRRTPAAERNQSGGWRRTLWKSPQPDAPGGGYKRSFSFLILFPKHRTIRRGSTCCFPVAASVLSVSSRSILPCRALSRAGTSQTFPIHFLSSQTAFKEVRLRESKTFFSSEKTRPFLRLFQASLALIATNWSTLGSR